MTVLLKIFSFFFFNDTATTEIYTLSLHDALPISVGCYYGGMLARAGHDVTLIARAQHVEAVQKRGLRMETRRSTRTCPCRQARRRAARAARSWCSSR